MEAGDWLQGPYVYYLYMTYGYGKGEIGQLFIAGFGTSMLFGTIVGSLADKQSVSLFKVSFASFSDEISQSHFSLVVHKTYFRDQKRACVTYCITYMLSCMTKHSPKYKVLMLGFVLGGIATSLLFSSFDSWLVAEHNKVIH